MILFIILGILMGKANDQEKVVSYFDVTKYIYKKFS